MDIAGSRYKVSTLLQSQSQSRRVHSTVISSDFPFTVLPFYNGSVYNSGCNVSAEEPVDYTGPSYLVFLGQNSESSPRILVSAGETGGQWQVQDPHSGRVWSRRFNPYNTDYVYLKTTTTSVVLVHVKDDALQIKAGMNSHTSFSPLPVSALSTKYIMSSCLPTVDIPLVTASYIAILVIATHSNKADINVIFRLDGNVTYDGRTYIDGDTLSISLDRYQTFSLNSSSDMTRTIVNATDTIAVYSGTYHVDDRIFTTFEQLLPVKHYGHEYIVAIEDTAYYSGYKRDPPYQLQVVTDHSDTIIMFNNGSSISVGEDGVYRKQCGNSETFYFNTTRPVMATLCRVIELNYFDVLVVVPPVNLYSTITAIASEGDSDTMLILTDHENVDVQLACHTPSLLFSPPVKWKNVSGTRYKVGISPGSKYRTTTTVRSNSTFAVLGYYDYVIYNGGYSFKTHPDTAGNPTKAVIIVGVVCGAVIVALLVALVTKVLCMCGRKLPVKKNAKPGVDIPSASNYDELEVVQSELCEEVYTEIK